MHHIGQVVEATVDRLLPFGVFVHLKDMTPAYIRRRELSLEGDIDPRQLLNKGQSIEAKVIAPAEGEHSMELSIRQTLPDPWEDFLSEFQVGDVVTAPVKHVAPDRVFVQIRPGIDGLILLEDLASLKIARLDDLFWMGDRVQAVITRLDAANRRARLSIHHRMEQLARVEAVMTYLHQNTTETSARHEEVPPTPALTEDLGTVALDGPILVVEDHEDVRGPLVKWLTDRGCLAQGIDLARTALQRCTSQEYSLVIVDLDMPEMDGLSFIQQLRTMECVKTVVVMSDPILIADNLPSLQALEVAAVFPKPLDLIEVHQFLLRLAHGERPTLSWHAEPEEEPASAHPFQTLSHMMRSGKPLKDRLEQGLIHLIQETQAELGIVFHLDLAAWKVSVLTQVGTLPLYDKARHALVESPVKDVIVEDKIIWNNQCSNQFGQFRKLLAFVPFESCIGVPIRTGGQIEHALFLFHRNPDVFSHYRVRDTLAMATLFSVTLENQRMMAQARSLSNILLSGHLARAFGHEVYNKLSGLDLQFHNLHTELERLTEKHTQVTTLPAFQEVRQMFKDVAETASELQQTVKAFQELMRVKEEITPVQVNVVVRRAVKEIKPLARKAKTSVRLDLAKDLPRVIGNRVGLYQIFINLMLNAIQQMELAHTNKRTLDINTCVATHNDAQQIEIRFIDTGPGIHHKLWERIFALGFTTRPGGSGLGLYISRSFLESIGGQVIVEESLVPLGTTFLVTLPADGEKEHHDQ
jgi:signal transduction histidine kinase/predicted RNA-binding protein with RPS1 domain/DNA-binding NarL/FixJ family response regulator